MKKLHHSVLFMLAFCATAVVMLSADTPFAVGSSDDTAAYSVTFVPFWNPETHDLEYPVTHAKHGLLTPMIGATHGSGYRIFAAGQKPSPGLERLSEMGKHDPLDAEIKKAIAGGKAGSLIEFSDGSPGLVHGAVTQSFTISKRYPLVSLVGMIAPSPDWFYGVSSLELRKDGRWKAYSIVEVFAWDSGGDGGTTYMAEDQDLNPKQETKLADTPHFNRGNQKAPVGVFIFKHIPSMEMLSQN